MFAWKYSLAAEIKLIMIMIMIMATLSRKEHFTTVCHGCHDKDNDNDNVYDNDNDN